ncbi:MAG: ATP-binding protein, partial [Oscillospiraceae bacterium]
RSGTISIGMDPEKERNLVISDTGIGIRGEDLPRVFEKGFTGYNGRLNKKSSGIGLYMCQKVLNNLSHQITITSTPQKGTQVSINLSSIRLEVE